jgi:hypothetical protein
VLINPVNFPFVGNSQTLVKIGKFNRLSPTSIDRPKVVIDAVGLKGTLLPEAVQERW